MIIVTSVCVRVLRVCALCVCVCVCAVVVKERSVMFVNMYSLSQINHRRCTRAHPSARPALPAAAAPPALRSDPVERRSRCQPSLVTRLLCRPQYITTTSFDLQDACEQAVQRRITPVERRSRCQPSLVTRLLCRPAQQPAVACPARRRSPSPSIRVLTSPGSSGYDAPDLGT